MEVSIAQTVLDRQTYEDRLTYQNLNPYKTFIYHELSHFYIANESLTQFLDTYLYNLIQTNSTNAIDWIYPQYYTAWQESNGGYFALLDIYQLIGIGGMSKAYKTIYSIHPPYRIPLSSECK